MGGPDDADDADLPLSTLPGGGSFRLCRDMASSLAGSEVTLWNVKNQDNLIAVSVGDTLECVDSAAWTYKLGLINIPSPFVPLGCGGWCEPQEGTPMPAYKVGDSVYALGSFGN
jgi:hypothetical protein